MTRLPLLSNSAIATFRRCPREYHFKYRLLRRARSKSMALRFGSLFHLMLNAWWKCQGSPFKKLDAALDVMPTQTDLLDMYELEKARALIIGYTARWGVLDEHETISVGGELAVEWQFRHDLTDSFDMGGAIDVIAQPKGKKWIRTVEHKTTSEDISPGSDYWRHVTSLEPQVSTYQIAARLKGLDVRDTLYDVVRKPNLDPYKATPEDKRKYTIPTAKDPIPHLYKNQRERDETPEEYGNRVAKDIEENPDWYFMRSSIVRLENEETDHMLDTREAAYMIQWCTLRKAFPRSPTGCKRFGRLCEYHDVCSGGAVIEDDSRFETKERAHTELEPTL